MLLGPSNSSSISFFPHSSSSFRSPCCFSLSPFFQHIIFDYHTYSRHGREINILAAMKHEMPKMTMDCELWYGRGQYSLSSDLVTKNIFFCWDFLRYFFLLLFSTILLIFLITGWWRLILCLLQHWKYHSKIDTNISLERYRTITHLLYLYFLLCFYVL